MKSFQYRSRIIRGVAKSAGISYLLPPGPGVEHLQYEYSLLMHGNIHQDSIIGCGQILERKALVERESLAEAWDKG